MSSQATPQLLKARRAKARKEFPAILNSYLEDYIASIKAKNPKFNPNEEEREEIKLRLHNSLSLAAR